MKPNRYSPPTASLEPTPTSLPPLDIDALQVSAAWKRRFKAVGRRTGEPIAAVNPVETRPLDVLNLPAFALGPLYYAVKGMWRKGFTLLALCLVCLFLVDVIYWLASGGRNHIGSVAAFCGAGAVFGLRANSDFYKKVVHHKNGWW